MSNTSEDYPKREERPMKTADFYGHIYIVGKECKFEWAGECTPDDCNFVYCEHNNNRVLTSETTIINKEK